MARRDTILRGLFLHTIKDGKINWQGEILRHNSREAVVQLYSWLMGEATNTVVIPIAEIHDHAKCRLYATRAEWIAASQKESDKEDREDEAPPPKQPLVDPKRMGLAECYQINLRGVVPDGTKPEDLHLKPDAFSACAGLLTLGDHLTLITQGETHMFRGVCVSGDRGQKVKNPLVCVLESIALPGRNKEKA